MIRTDLSQAVLSRTVATVLKRLGSQLPTEVVSSEAHAEGEISFTKGLATMMSTFAAVSLALALIGIYAIVAFGVVARTREIGIRVALGARPADVIRVVMRNGAQLTAIGLALGLAVSTMMGKIMAGFIVGTVTTTIVTSIVVTAGFAAVALAASYLPARRAARMDPVVALRS
jgi:ABC-type antimicrobial peptide transport system permease subunit